jgi:GAF domain-containing protein
MPNEPASTSQPQGEDLDDVRLNRLLNLILESAVEALGFDAATVSARHAGTLSTVGLTDPRLLALDEAQYESGEGPCLAVLDGRGSPLLTPDASTDDRWQLFRQTAEHLGIHTTLSVYLPLAQEEDLAGSLNLYSRRRFELADRQVRAADAFAAQLAAAMEGLRAYHATARLARQMADAMRNRASIEQAKGIIIAERGGTPDEAFAALVEISQHSNTKLHTVAERIVRERAERRVS